MAFNNYCPVIIVPRLKLFQILPLQNSIVHRDLKLENILLDENQQPKVNIPDNVIGYIRNTI
jgi:serine/threonine protein kinase